MFWSTMRVPVRGDSSGFSLKNRDMTSGARSRPVFKWDTYELGYRYSQGESEVYYWELPEEFLGNKLGAYGGNITVMQRAVFRGDAVDDSEVIMTGNGLTLHYSPEGGSRASRASEVPEKNQFMLTEKGWFVLNTGVPVPATRDQMLAVLSNIEVTTNMVLSIIEITNIVFSNIKVTNIVLPILEKTNIVLSNIKVSNIVLSILEKTNIVLSNIKVTDIVLSIIEITNVVLSNIKVNSMAVLLIFR